MGVCLVPEDMYTCVSKKPKIAAAIHRTSQFIKGAYSRRGGLAEQGEDGFGLWSVYVPPSSLGPVGHLHRTGDYIEGEPWLP